MIAIYFLPVYLVTHFFIFRLFYKWLVACHSVFQGKIVYTCIAAVYTYCVFAMYIGAVLPHGTMEKIVKLTGFYWYGITLYTYLFVFAALLLRFLLSLTNLKNAAWFSSEQTFRIVGALCILGIAACCIGGKINAGIIRTTNYEVALDKDGGEVKELNAVLVGDLHIGFNIREKHMTRMVEKINACNPDVVLIAGDFFDNEYDAVQEPEKIISVLQGIQSKYGVYAVYGNHDCEEMIIGGFTFTPKGVKPESNPLMDEFVAKSGITLLRDEAVLLADSIYLYGRPDEERPGRGIEERKTPEELMSTMDPEKPILVLEHEPKALGELAASGIDLHLAGHTHDGQTFPLNITSKIIWENSCGMLQKGNMTSIVTSGAGLFGPNMRVGTIPEICSIHITLN